MTRITEVFFFLVGSNRCVCHTDMGEVQMEGPAKEKEQGRQTVPQKIRAQMLRV